METTILGAMLVLGGVDVGPRKILRCSDVEVPISTCQWLLQPVPHPIFDLASNAEMRGCSAFVL